MNDEVSEVYCMRLLDLDIKEKQQPRYVNIILGKKYIGEEIWWQEKLF